MFVIIFHRIMYLLEVRHRTFELKLKSFYFFIADLFDYSHIIGH